MSLQTDERGAAVKNKEIVNKTREITAAASKKYGSVHFQSDVMVSEATFLRDLSKMLTISAHNNS